MVHFEKAVLFYNKIAGDSDVEQKLADTVPILGRVIDELTLISTETESDLQTKCRNMAELVDLMIFLGGDGTVHTAINSIAPLQKRPVIAILPGGTSNDFSRTLNIPQRLSEAAESLAQGKLIPIDVGKSNDDYFLNFWGIGLVSDTSKNVDGNQKESFGVLSYFMSTLKTIREADSFQYEIHADGGVKREGEAVLVFVLNGCFVGTRRLPINSINPRDGIFDILIARNSNLASLRELMSLKNPDTDVTALTELDYFQARELKIITDSAKDIDMDGEINTRTPSVIQVLPNHLEFLVPFDFA
ncbi:YegS/Rv2252/BmrU family lipid kinase [Aciduricibacillus chroicocephali]|uniref:YegS/Rv2252/BmrU family lipid kinase n=1 Tax=Aciduricibacillus chroicocephali TaxID=3054939 RepID=A0ABY9KT10_9BACI|nr:YegS/Rv2252/BmrU family lipid kinase [Bacillaceae bacterium 44XB]